MITTYLSDEEFKKYSSCADKDINEALQEVNALPGRLVFIQEQAIRKHTGLIRRGYVESLFYTVYLHRYGPEVHTVNFFMEGSGTSINTTVPKSVALAYLYGIITGYHIVQTQSK